jgi:hypothetical protein
MGKWIILIPLAVIVMSILIGISILCSYRLLGFLGLGRLSQSIFAHRFFGQDEETPPLTSFLIG